MQTIHYEACFTSLLHTMENIIDSSEDNLNILFYSNILSEKRIVIQVKLDARRQQRSVRSHDS